ELLDEKDQLLGSTSNSTPLTAGESATLTQNITIFDLDTGNYNLLFVADRNDNQIESNEANNLIVRPIQITAPDLTVSAVSTKQETAQPGQTINVSWTVNNSGTQTATGTWVDRLYLSTDGTLDNSTLLTSITRNQALSVGESYTASTGITFPDVADGNYRLLVVTDAERQLVESPTKESNNQRLSGQFPIERFNRIDALRQQALSLAVASLVSFKDNPEQLASVQKAFGQKGNSEAALGLIEGVISGEAIPTIEIISAKTLKANGAFSKEANTIYLSREFLEQNAEKPEAIAKVLLEEIGHYWIPS
ncbi:MAG: hypothetical protein HC820_01605, partial [Hydrococcus sp. RM1_1_31]|nr:hypothetical protein [Hydrococcus sp. RM1_1_31]